MTDILSTYDLAKLFISTLKSTATIVALFNDEIRRSHWGNDKFVYPALRVDVNRMDETPLNGNCKGKWFDISVSTYIFTEGASQKECELAMKAVGTRFKNAQIGDTVIKSQPLKINFMPVVSDGFNHWRGEVVITGQVHEA